MSIDTRSKQPGDHLDFDVDFAKWLPDNDKITTVEAVVDPDGVVLEAYENVSPIVKIWISGGVTGASHKVTVTVGTQLGRIKETEFRLRIKEI